MRDWNHLGSEVIKYEIEQMPDEERIGTMECSLNLLFFGK